MPRMTRAIVVVAIALMPLLAAVDAVAGPATDQVRVSIDRVLQILSDPELKQATKTSERRAAIRVVANEIFDFTEISQRSLARHWAARTPAERSEERRVGKECATG